MYDIYNAVSLDLNHDFQSKLRTEKKIKSFAKKVVGWHYGQGVPPSERRVSMALDYLFILQVLGFHETDAFPGIDGEIMVRAYKEGVCFSLSIEINYKTVLSIYGLGMEDYEEDNLLMSQSVALLVVKMEEVLSRECNTHDSLTQSITITGQNPLSITPSKTAQTVAVRPSSARNALPPAADLYASTLGTTTQISPQVRQYSGHSMRLYSECLAA